jgi:hypothetical protein
MAILWAMPAESPFPMAAEFSGDLQPTVRIRITDYAGL